MASVIDSHPQRKEIIDAILAGGTLRGVADRFGVSGMAIHRFKKNVIAPAILRTPLSPNVLGNRPDALQAVADVQASRNVAQEEARLAPIIERLRKREARREALLSEAAEAKDFRGFASLDTCEHRDIELECRLAGLLDGPSTGSTTINQTVVLIPAMPDMQSQAAPAIDATCEPAE